MSRTEARRLVTAVVTVSGLLAGGQLSSTHRIDETVSWVGRFSSQLPGSRPADWRPQGLPHHRRQTQYHLVTLDGRTALKADSDRSASALVRTIQLDPQRHRYLEWSWKIDRVIPDGRWGTKGRDDFAGRVFVIFDGSRNIWSLFRKMMMKFGGGLPGRAVNYVWANHATIEATARSPYTGRVVMLAVESGDTRAGTWVVERRDVVEDFTAAFGRAPKTIRGVAVMTDTDDTRSRRATYYGDIRFRSDTERSEPPRPSVP